MYFSTQAVFFRGKFPPHLAMLRISSTFGVSKLCVPNAGARNRYIAHLQVNLLWNISITNILYEIVYTVQYYLSPNYARELETEISATSFIEYYKKKYRTYYKISFISKLCVPSTGTSNRYIAHLQPNLLWNIKKSPKETQISPGRLSGCSRCPFSCEQTSLHVVPRLVAGHRVRPAVFQQAQCFNIWGQL